MTICELTKEQYQELKQHYLTEHLAEVENRFPSYSELINADEIVPDSIIMENYGHYDFSEDDFCS